MKSLLKITILVLFSVKAYAAVGTYSLSRMSEEVQKMKNTWIGDCKNSESEYLKLSAVKAEVNCSKTIKKIQKDICSKKKELVSYFEAILDRKNIADVTNRFTTQPTPEAIGAMLIWQMKNSVNQVNQSWFRQVDLMNSETSRCISGDLKSELTKETDYVKEVISQATLTVEATRVVLREKLPHF